jgi:hypothetical protein
MEHGKAQGLGTLIVHKVCLASRMVEVIGTVVGEQIVKTEFEGTFDCWLVDFEHDGIQFRGLWRKD